MLFETHTSHQHVWCVLALLMLCLAAVCAQHQHHHFRHHPDVDSLVKERNHQCTGNVTDLMQNDTSLHQLTFIPPSQVHIASMLFHRLGKMKNEGKTLNALFTGSSITTMGYFYGFLEFLRNIEGLKVEAFNRGFGATDTTYSLFCIDIDDSKPDIVFADMRHSDWAKRSDVAEALFRKYVTMRTADGHVPLVVVINFSHMGDECPLPVKYNAIAMHYGFPIIDLCNLVKYCFGVNNYQSNWKTYSGDQIHPNTDTARKFITDVLVDWWKDLRTYVALNETVQHSDWEANRDLFTNPDAKPYLYFKSKISTNTTCMTANNNAVAGLHPIGTPVGFYLNERVKTGAQGFQNVKRCWEGNNVNDSITFEFYGRTLFVALFQRPKGMGVMDVYLDHEKSPRKSITGYFEGYNWLGRHRDNGRQEVLGLFDGDIPAGKHNVTFVVSDKVANPNSPGHSSQIIALLSEKPSQSTL